MKAKLATGGTFKGHRRVYSRESILIRAAENARETRRVETHGIARPILLAGMQQVVLAFNQKQIDAERIKLQETRSEDKWQVQNSLDRLLEVRGLIVRKYEPEINIAPDRVDFARFDELYGRGAFLRAVSIAKSIQKSIANNGNDNGRNGHREVAHLRWVTTTSVTHVRAGQRTSLRRTLQSTPLTGRGAEFIPQAPIL